MNPSLLLLKDMLKKVLKVLPFALTQNQRYDRQTEAIIRKVCRPHTNCVDVGTHRGEILDLMRVLAPGGQHFGFEPLPHFYKSLLERYADAPSVHIFPFALSDTAGTASFNWVTTNPAYSGLKKRHYDRPNEQEQAITVEMRTLDSVVFPYQVPVGLMKIDVEGGEMGVLRGAEELLRRDRPVIIFEFGLGGSDVYGTTPRVLLDFLEPLCYRVYLLHDYLRGRAPLTGGALEEQFYGRKNFYFVAATAI